MLKFIFWALLSINGILFAYGQGYLGNFSGNEREPARLKNQLGSDRLRLLPAATAAAGAVLPATAATAAAAPAAAAAPLACLEIGTFNAAEARRFEARIAPLALGERQSRVDVAAQEITSYMVHLAPQGSKEAAERKAAELKNLGVASYFVMNDDSPLKWAISLGVFKSESAAQTQLAMLAKQGVQNARIAGRGPQGTRSTYRFRAIDDGARAQLEQAAARFPGRQARACKAPARP